MIKKEKEMKKKKILLTLDTTDSKESVDNTASVRQKFIDMVLRNNNVAPQV